MKIIVSTGRAVTVCQVRAKPSLESTSQHFQEGDQRLNVPLKERCFEFPRKWVTIGFTEKVQQPSHKIENAFTHPGAPSPIFP